MTSPDQIAEILDACDERREARRNFLRTSGAAALFASTSVLAACSDSNNSSGNGNSGVVPPTTPPPTTPPTQTFNDVDILNFALNLEYLEAQFYSFAAFGTGLPDNLLNGTGTRGLTNGGRQVPFSDALVAQYAREIATDERQHVAFLRTALGGSAVAQPNLDIDTNPNSAFSSAARAAGLVGAGQSFDPYANDENFLLGAFIFEDVGVTAYKGASPLITNKTFLEAAAGILAAESYHAGLVRTVLYAKGLQTPSLRPATDSISNARDSLDATTDVDQGVSPINGASNIVPTDANGLAYSRSAGDVLNIVYLTAAAAEQGGFFPSGVNGNIRLSSAS